MTNQIFSWLFISWHESIAEFCFWPREASYIDFVYKKRHMDVGEAVGACHVSRWKISIVLENFYYFEIIYTKYTKSSIFVSVFTF